MTASTSGIYIVENHWIQISGKFHKWEISADL